MLSWLAFRYIIVPTNNSKASVSECSYEMSRVTPEPGCTWHTCEEGAINFQAKGMQERTCANTDYLHP